MVEAMELKIIQSRWHDLLFEFHENLPTGSKITMGTRRQTGDLIIQSNYQIQLSLSLLVSCKLSIPIVVLKISSLATFTWKSHN
jgi:hypothetical protein